MSCQSCKSDSPVNKVKWSVLLLGSWVLGSSIYGSVIIFNNLINYIKVFFGI